MMPRVVKPGGRGGRICVHYTARRKHALSAAARHLQGEGRLLQSAADELHVSAANLSRWAVQKIDNIDPLDALFKMRRRQPILARSAS